MGWEGGEAWQSQNWPQERWPLQHRWDPGQPGPQEREHEESQSACRARVRAGEWARIHRGSSSRQSYQTEKALDMHSTGAL